MAEKIIGITGDHSVGGVSRWLDPTNRNFSMVAWQQGKPPLDSELNLMQQIQNEARASLVRSMYYSGVTEFPGVTKASSKVDATEVGRGTLFTDVTTNTTASNTGTGIIRMASFTALINGYRAEINRGSVNVKSGTPTDGENWIVLNEAPKTGTRTDLVFLEAWFEEIAPTDNPEGTNSTVQSYGGDGTPVVTNDIQDGNVGDETTRRIQLRWRFRVVDGQEDLSNKVKARGGALVDTALGFAKHKTDKGLWVAGTGDSSSKNALGAVDGYVYAIPLFRVDRRNSGEYSVENPNGAEDYYFSTFTSVGTTANFTPGETRQFTVADSNVYNKLKVGDTLIPTTLITTYSVEVVSKDGDNKVTLYHSGTKEHKYSPELCRYLPANPRPDGLFANVIDPRDITDLRHVVPTSVDYNKVLTEEFNRYMRGENGNKKMLKTYHGVRKTPIDSSTVFYASMDGTITPERGTISNTLGESNQLFKEMLPTGVGLANKAGTDDVLSYNMGTDINIGGSFTAELWFKPTDLRSAYGVYLRSGADKLLLRLLGFIYEEGKLKFQTGLYFNDDTTTYDYVDVDLTVNESYHVRVTYNSGTETLKYFINGKVVKEYTKPVTEKLALKTVSITSVHLNYGSNVSVSDISISNLDKGDVFATLPKDFIMGYAKIKPSFNSQNKIQSDAQTSQTTSDVISPVTSDNKHITKTQSSIGVWTAGDTIKVRALGGGVIGGVIDADTALARVVKDVTNNQVITVDDVSKLSVGDVVRVTNSEFAFVVLNASVLSIDATNKTITIDGNVTVSAGGYVVETTTTTSVPVVTATGVAGTWNNLGSNEATFTITTPPTTNTDTIKIQYSVNYPTGRGGLSDVLNSVLSAEVKGKKLVLGNQVVSDDFNGKIPGSTVANPHSFHRVSSADVLAPTSGSWIEEGSSAYNEIAKNNGVAYMHQTSTSGERAQVKISLNLIRMFEDKFGVGIFKGCKTVADKIQLIKDNVYTITANWYGYGSNGDGNKATLAYWHHPASSYASGTKTHSESSIARLTLIMSGGGINSIDDNGFIHLNVYAEPSNGTAPSQIFTDYVDVVITLKDKAGYDLLVPENSRRDGGEANILYVRKETNEIELIAPADENSGLVTWGLYTPPAKQISTEFYATILAEGDGFLISDLGTSVGHKQGSHPWLNPLYRVRNNPKDVFGEFGFGEVPFSADTKGANIGAKIYLKSFGHGGFYTRQYGLTTIKKPLVGIARFLVLHDGELKLLVYSLYSNKGDLSVGNGNAVGLLVPISGRPLVKEPEGIKRSNADVPKPWRTSTGVIEGYLNDKGEVIVTYQ